MGDAVPWPYGVYAHLPKLTLSWDAKRRIHRFSSIFIDEHSVNGVRGKKRQKKV